MIKKILKFTGIFLFVVILAAIAIPYFFKDQIVAAVKEDINKSVNAEVDFADVSLSLLSSFPDFSFGIKELSVIGVDEFAGYPLVKAKAVNLSLDLMSVISSDSPIEINSVELVQPEIKIKVLKNGHANYDIAKTTSEAETTESSDLNFVVQLKKYEIEDGVFVYDDRPGSVYVSIEDLDHSGKGAFTQDIFDLATQTSIGQLTAKSGGVTYLKRAKADMDITFNADIPNAKYTLKDNQVKLNALTLNADGFIQMLDDKINLDLKYDAPKNNFKNFLSLIPSAYTADFQDVEANGALQFNGFVKGTYNLISGALPAFQLNLKVDNADFKYPDLPLGINGINTVAKINSPSSDLDKMMVDVSNFSMKLANNPFEASVKLWSLMSDPNIDSKFNGTINLDELSKAFPIEGVKKLNGLISSNLTAKTSMSAIDLQEYEKVDMSGDLRIENMDYQAEGTPPIKIADLQMNFNPKNVKLDNFDAQFGKSDIKASGTLDNFIAYFAPDKTMTGKLTLRSKVFDANEWISAGSTEEPAPDPLESDSLVSEDVFDRFDFTVDGAIGKLYYDVYELKDSRLVGNVTPNKAEVTEFQTKIGESDFEMTGTITNVFDYLYENETMRGDIRLASNYINLNEFMVETESETPKAQTISENAAAALEPILVPEKMDFDINADIGKVLYTNIEMRDIKGRMKVKDQTVAMKDCNAKMLGGNFTMNGTYNTQNSEKPRFDMDYKVNRFDFQDAFETLNTFQALAPISKFIEGQFNTSLSLNGELTNEMLPDLNSISAKGFLQTINGTLINFEPVQKLADKLNIKQLKSLNLENTKNWFEVENGRVTVKPFDIKSNGINMNISGSHGLSAEMNYNIKAKIPRNLLQKNAAGQAADKGLNFLQGQASKLGIDIAQSEFINVSALLTGTISDPKIKISLLGADGEAATLDNLVDNVKDQAIDKASELIEEKTGVDVQNIEEEIKETKENLSAKADAEIAALREKSEANITKLINEAEKRAQQTRDEAQKLSDKTKNEGYKQAESLIKKAGNNPFKKKGAEIAAKKLKEETDKKANQIVQKGEDTAQGILKKANDQASKLRTETDKQAEAIRAKYQ